ncbi:MAG TPA: DsbA family oxidoreductase [Dehalococcoidia bacterium]|nr:DsbA family oxidoreductase [Dehalococcoidia bacterium]
MALAVDHPSQAPDQRDAAAVAGSGCGQRQQQRPALAPLPVRIVADYICPWCYIGLARAERVAQELPLVLEPWPYQLMPHLPPGGLPREAALGRRYPRQHYQQLQEQAEGEGIPFQVPERLYNTGLAHQAVLFAAAQGRGRELHRAIYQAYWGRGEDIGDAEVLCRLAEGCGLDATALERALEEGTYRREMERREAWARGQGIAGVPTFIFGDGLFALVGAQDYAVFRDVARRLMARLAGG